VLCLEHYFTSKSSALIHDSTVFLYRCYQSLQIQLYKGLCFKCNNLYLQCMTNSWPSYSHQKTRQDKGEPSIHRVELEPAFISMKALISVATGIAPKAVYRHELTLRAIMFSFSGKDVSFYLSKRLTDSLEQACQISFYAAPTSGTYK
jgi:hypothetical protein